MSGELQMSHVTSRCDLAFLSVVVLSCAVVLPSWSFAESLLSLPQPDLLATMGAPEALPRTRKAQVIYPAPGLPSLIRPGQEIVVRVRVRRAMTPPPGIPQPNVLLGWGARLVSSVTVMAPGVGGDLDFPLEVHQIRPEDEGFVYRVRLRTPEYLPSGVYSLRFDGPGFSDTRPRAVRVLDPEVETLDLAVVASGQSLWREAEGLALLDPAAVLVPGGLGEAALPLSRSPLATFAVTGPNDVIACRSVELDDELATAVAEAAECPRGSSKELARCVAEAIGTAEGLRPCGDGLLTHARRFGPPAYAVGLGNVSLLGLNTVDRPPAERAVRRIRLGDGPVLTMPLPSEAQTRGAVGATQRSWAEHVVRFAEAVLILGYHPPREWRESGRGHLLNAFHESPGLYVAAGPGDVDLPVVRGPAMIELRAVTDSSPADALRQLRGFEPGRFELGKTRSRRALAPARLSVVASSEGLVIGIRRPPPQRLRLRALVPAATSGWKIAARTTGRQAQIAGSAPGGGDLCDPTQQLLTIEILPGPERPIELSLEPTEAAPLDVGFSIPRESIIVGRTAELRATGSDRNDNGVVVFWDFGDGSSARGKTVQHRYIRSGPARICALALDRRGRGISTVVDIHVDRWETTPLGSPGVVRGVGGALIVLAVVVIFLAMRKGNMLGSRRRLS